MDGFDRTGDRVDIGKTIHSISQSGHEAEVDTWPRLAYALHVVWRKLTGYQNGSHLLISSDSLITMTSKRFSSGNATWMPSPSAMTSQGTSPTSARALAVARIPLT